MMRLRRLVRSWSDGAEQHGKVAQAVKQTIQDYTEEHLIETKKTNIEPCTRMEDNSNNGYQEHFSNEGLRDKVIKYSIREREISQEPMRTQDKSKKTD